MVQPWQLHIRHISNVKVLYTRKTNSYLYEEPLLRLSRIHACKTTLLIKELKKPLSTIMDLYKKHPFRLIVTKVSTPFPPTHQSIQSATGLFHSLCFILIYQHQPIIILINLPLPLITEDNYSLTFHSLY